MDERERDVTPVPREVLVKQGISAVLYLAGGAFLLLMAIGSRIGLLGMVLSLVALVVGIGAILSKDREDKKPGILLTAAGILGMVMRLRVPFFQAIAGTVLAAGAFSLFIAGIWKGINFLRGLKSRQ